MGADEGSDPPGFARHGDYLLVPAGLQMEDWEERLPEGWTVGFLTIHRPDGSRWWPPQGVLDGS